MLRIRNHKPKIRVPFEEWDFTRVPPREYRACCYYEYGRESSFIIQHLENPPHYSEVDPHLEALKNSPLTDALPLCRGGTQSLNDPWLQRTPEWRAQVCKAFAENPDGLSFARTLKKTPERAFQIGIAPPFPASLWPNNETRYLDPKTGLEVLIATIDWGNFTNQEIVKQFTRWLETARQEAVGLGDLRGKKASEWQMNLEKLAVLRLRHYYPPNEIESVLPAQWKEDKFYPGCEMNRACEAACKALTDLFPFLPKDTRPIRWKSFGSEAKLITPTTPTLEATDNP